MKTYFAPLLLLAFLSSAAAAQQVSPASGLTSEPTWDPGFAIPGTDEPVQASAIFDDGSGPALYIAGDFRSAHLATSYGIARFRAGKWENVGQGMTPTSQVQFESIFDMTVFDDGSGAKLWVTGRFDGMDGLGASGLATWDGTQWRVPAFLRENGGLGVGQALATHSGVLYVGGSFDMVNEVAASNVAVWNGVSWSALGAGMSGNVSQLAVSEAGGTTALYAATPAVFPSEPTLFQWSASTWSPVGNIQKTVGALIDYPDTGGSKLIIGTSPIRAWDGNSVSLFGGPGAPDSASSFAVANAEGASLLYVGGSFPNSGTIFNGVAAWDGTTWSALGTPAGVAHTQGNRRVSTLAVGVAGELYSGGNFDRAGGKVALNAARWNGVDWSALGKGEGFTRTSGADASVHALGVLDDGSGRTLYAGGSFDVAGGKSVSGLVRWEGGTWRSFGGGIGAGNRVFSMAAFDDGSGTALYFGGALTEAGGAPAQGIVRWDGNSFGNGAINGDVHAMVVHDDGTGPALYIGGDFRIPAPGLLGIARWNGSSWSSVGGGLPISVGEEVLALEVHDDGTGPALYAGGDFDGAAGSNLSRWDGVSWTPVGGGIRTGSSSVDGEVAALLSTRLTPSGEEVLVVGGHFDRAGTTTALNIAAWDGSAWSPIGAGFDLGPGYQKVEALHTHHDGRRTRLIAGGKLGLSGGKSMRNLAQWTGTRWVRLGEGLSYDAYALASFSSSPHERALWVGGWFISAGSMGSLGIARRVQRDIPVVTHGAGSGTGAAPMLSSSYEVESNRLEVSLERAPAGARGILVVGDQVPGSGGLAVVPSHRALPFTIDERWRSKQTLLSAALPRVLRSSTLALQAGILDAETGTITWSNVLQVELSLDR